MEGPSQAAPPEATDVLPRQLGDFTAHSVLGAGGSGIVYAAYWGHRDVALKVLRADLVATDTERRRFLDEARALSEIDHPAVVKVLHFGELPDRRPFLAMELVAGETLGARLARGGAIALPTALDLFDQLVGAVSAMHGRGLVHRDLKPENVILLPGDAFLVLLDFGIAKEVDARPSTVTQEGGIRGTPAYMAPERFFGQVASVRTDIYELGVVLYMMLTGRLPWDSVADPAGRLDPRRPSAVGVMLPTAVESQLLRALSTRPEMRPVSARELAAALRAAAELPAAASARATADIAGAGLGPPARLDRCAARVRGPRLSPGIRLSLDRQGLTVAHALPLDPGMRRRRRVLVGAAALVGIAAAAATIAVAVSRSDAPAAAVPATATPAADPIAAPEQVSSPPPRRDADDSGLFAIARHLPAETGLVVGVRVRELRKSQAFAAVFDSTRDSLYLNMARLYASPCKIDPLEDTDWIVLGADSPAGKDAEIAISGNWSRDQIEGCAGDISSALGRGKPERVVRDGPVTRLELPGAPVLLGWLDDRTFLVSTRATADAAWMKARIDGVGSAHDGGAIAAVLPRVDTRATIWMIGGPPEPAIAKNLFGDVEAPSPVWFAITVAADIAAVGGGQSTSPAAAEAAKAALERRAKAEIDSEPVSSVLLTKLSVTTEGDRVVAKLVVDESTTRLFARALEDLLKKGIAP